MQARQVSHCVNNTDVDFPSGERIGILEQKQEAQPCVSRKTSPSTKSPFQQSELRNDRGENQTAHAVTGSFAGKTSVLIFELRATKKTTDNSACQVGDSHRHLYKMLRSLSKTTANHSSVCDVHHARDLLTTSLRPTRTLSRQHP